MRTAPRPTTSGAAADGTQLDLFGHVVAGEVAARTRDRARVREGLTVLAEVHPEALEVLVHLADWRPRPDRTTHGGGGWAYALHEVHGLRYARTPTRSAPSCRAGWDATPEHQVTWAELAAALGPDPRRAQVVAWAAGKGWRDLVRPHELWPDGHRWHPGYYARDHAAPGWPARLDAWTTAIAVLSDADDAAALATLTDPDQETR